VVAGSNVYNRIHDEDGVMLSVAPINVVVAITLALLFVVLVLRPSGAKYDHWFGNNLPVTTMNEA
jgi:hypothetical protein